MRKNRRLAVPGARIFLTESGKDGARPVILLHGGPGMPGYMDILGDLISDRAFIVDYRQRGTAKSPSRGSFRIKDHCEDLNAIVKTYSTAMRPVVIGSSWGAILALCYAARYPGKVHRFILIGTGPLEEATYQTFIANIAARLSAAAFARRNRLVTKMEDKTLSRARRTRLDEDFLKIILPVYNHNRSSFKGIALEPRNHGPVGETDADCAERRKSGRLLADLEAVRDEVVAIHGDYDPIPFRGVLPRLAKGIGRFKSHVVKNCGHVPWLEKNSRAGFLRVLREAIC